MQKTGFLLIMLSMDLCSRMPAPSTALLGEEGYKAKDYRGAARYYGLVSECRTKDPQVPPLEPSDSIKLAKCWALQGNKSLARSRFSANCLIRRSFGRIRNYFIRLCRVCCSSYGGFCEERIRLLQLAISCLPEDSPTGSHRYRALAAHFFGPAILLKPRQS